MPHAAHVPFRRVLLSVSALSLLALAPCRAAAQEADGADVPKCGVRGPVEVRDDAADALESYVVTPQSARTVVGDEVRLTLASSDPRAPICRVVSWSVNGVPGGNATLGRIRGSASGAVYEAPAQVAESGLKVTVTATVETPPALGVRQVQLMSDIDVAGKRMSTCLPLAKGQTGGDFGCHYWALGLPRVVPMHGDGPRMFVDKIRLTVIEDDAGRPHEWQIAAWTHSEGADRSSQSDMNPFGTLEEVAPDIFRMTDSDGNRTALALHTREGSVVLDMFAQEAPMIFQLARDPSDFPRFDDPKRHAIEGPLEEYLREQERLRRQREHLRQHPEDDPKARAVEGPLKEYLEQQEARRRRTWDDPKADAIEGPLKEYLQQQELEASSRGQRIESMERALTEGGDATTGLSESDPKMSEISQLVHQWVADHPAGTPAD
jgi:hypothetical protein